MNEREIERIYKKLDEIDKKLDDHVEECAKDKTQLNLRLGRLERRLDWVLGIVAGVAVVVLGTLVKEALGL